MQEGVEAYQKAQADYLIAIGGGSSIDTAKGIGIIVTNPEFSDVRSLEGVANTLNKAAPIIAIPTTAGTAAEVTINYVTVKPSRLVHTFGMLLLMLKKIVNLFVWTPMIFLL